jgi:uncharacterized protein (UPF0335 family)
MSYHIMDKHRDNVIATAPNKEMLRNAIKEKNGTVRLYLTSPTDPKTKRSYIISLGYVSGWTLTPKMKKTLDKIKEHRDDHLKKCQELLDEINLTALKGKEEVVGDHSEAYETLKQSYDDMVKRCARLEKENDKMKRDADEEFEERQREGHITNDVIKTLCRLYNINKDALEEIEDDVKDIYDDVEDTDEGWADLRKRINNIRKRF